MQSGGDRIDSEKFADIDFNGRNVWDIEHGDGLYRDIALHSRSLRRDDSTRGTFDQFICIGRGDSGSDFALSFFASQQEVFNDFCVRLVHDLQCDFDFRGGFQFIIGCASIAGVFSSSLLLDGVYGGGADSWGERSSESGCEDKYWCGGGHGRGRADK